MDIIKQASHRAEITGLSHDGRGIARVDQRVVFIENALPGELVDFIYLKKNRKFSLGQAIQVSQASPNRVTPQCSHFQVCGGCSLQHLDHAQQLYFKQEVLVEQLKHIGEISATITHPPLVGKIWGYRSKARLAAKYVVKKQRLMVGFHERRGNYVVDTLSCPILDGRVGNHLEAIKALLNSLSVAQAVPQIEIAGGANRCGLVFRHLAPLNQNDYQNLLQATEHYPWQIYTQAQGIDAVQLVAPCDATPLSYQLPQQQLELFFAPTDFTQINPGINTQLVNLALTWLDLQPEDRVLDLFCGIGNFTLPIATRAKSVVGVEGSQHAVARASQNALVANLANLQCHVADLSKPLDGLPWAEKTYDKILLDPPRTGAQELCRELGRWRAQKILYVSCNPATFARDAKILTAQHSYQLQHLAVADMYPHTSHLEVIACFERR